MESEAKYTIVGAAVLGLVVMVILAVLWFTRKDISSEGKYYTIYFHEQDLSGLAENSFVTMRGIKVGSVNEIKIARRNIELVRVDIVTKPETPIKVDNEAVIKRNLLTGLASIDLINGTNNAPLLTIVRPDEKYPVIKEGKSELERLASSVPDLLAKVEGAMARINLLLSEDNVKNASESIEHIRAVSASLAQSEGDIKRLINKSADFADHADKRLEQASKSLLDSIERIASIMEGLGKQGQATTKSMQASATLIAQQIAELSQKVADAANNISAAALQYQDPRSIITGPSKEALGPGEAKRK